ncbi:MAG: efflux RND transporter periplasmic adaptor subunit [Wenzhouxiangella sp.]|nr:MAG: efflux RND transporter periplasmic adaptor subunit [Wenzhouxiangella sp.]
MKVFLKIVLPATLMIAISVGVVVLLASQRPAPPEREPTVSAMLVDVISAQPSAGFFSVQAQGTVRPRTETTIASEVSGRLVRVADNFTAGGFFRAGETLAEIDPSDYEAALLQAEAELASARSRLADESARSEQARRDWQRLHGSDREPGELVLRLPQVAGAQAAVQAAEAGVLRARRNLERTRISLPFDGLVRARQADLGQFVSTGTALAVVFAVDVAEVRLPLSDQDLAFLNLPSPGRSDSAEPVPVALQGRVGGQQGHWQAHIVRTEGVVDEATRLVYAVAEIADPYGLLGSERALPLAMGTFVQAEIRGQVSAGLIELPRAALRDGNTVYLANDDDELEIRTVEVMRTTPQRAYVHNNIHPGDRVITTAIQAPIPGLALRIRPTLETAAELRLLSAGQPGSEEADAP